MDHSLEPGDTREQLGAHANPRSEPSDELPRRETYTISHCSSPQALGDPHTRDLNFSVPLVEVTGLLKERRLEHVELSRGIACLEQAVPQDRTITPPEFRKVDHPLRDVRCRHAQKRPGASRHEAHTTNFALPDSVDDNGGCTRPLEARTTNPAPCKAVECVIAKFVFMEVDEKLHAA